MNANPDNMRPAGKDAATGNAGAGRCVALPDLTPQDWQSPPPARNLFAKPPGQDTNKPRHVGMSGSKS